MFFFVSLFFRNKFRLHACLGHGNGSSQNPYFFFKNTSPDQVFGRGIPELLKSRTLAEGEKKCATFA